MMRTQCEGRGQEGRSGVRRGARRAERRRGAGRGNDTGRKERGAGGETQQIGKPPNNKETLEITYTQ